MERSHMPSAPEQINALVRQFIDGQSSADFHRAFLAFHQSFDDTALPAAQRDAYWALYDLVSMRQPGSGAHPDTGAGAIGEAALRERLQHFHLREQHVPATQPVAATDG
jgi:hypothetical protein